MVKIKKLLNTIIIALLAVLSAQAVAAGNVYTNDYWFNTIGNAQTDVQHLIFKCTDETCSAPDGSPWYDQNSGAGNQLVIEFPGTPEKTHYAEFLLAECRLPMSFNSFDFGTGLTFQWDNTFVQSDDCKSLIDSFSVTNEVFPNEPVMIDMNADLDAEAGSGFTKLHNDVGFFAGDPDFYSAETKVTVTITDDQDNVVHTDSTVVNILADTTEPVHFEWVPTELGEYTAEVKTEVIDCQCTSTVPQTATKTFRVVAPGDKEYCYTLLNDLELDNPNPNAGDLLSVTANKISNSVDSFGNLQPLPTDATVTVFKDGQQVFTNSKNVPANADVVNAQSFSFDTVTLEAGSYSVVVDAEANNCPFVRNDAETETINFQVDPPVLPNRAPVFDPLPDRTVQEGNLLQFVVNAVDPDGDSLTYSAENVPAGASFNPNTQVFSWTPGFNDQGMYFVTFKVTDGQFVTAKTVKITVTDGTPPNRPPVMSPLAPKTIVEGNNLQFGVFATDADSDPLTFSASGLPAGATFNPTTQVFDWTPGFNQAGVYFVTFTVSDGQATDSETVQITVLDGVPPNNPPVLDPIGDKMVDEGQLLQFTISGSDPDGDSLTFSATGLPTGASFDANTRTFSWTPDFTQAGIYFVTFRVSDGLLSDSETVQITVKDATPANNPPVLDPIGDKMITEGQTLQFAISGSDPDGDPLTFSATGLPAGATFDPNNRVFMWTPGFNQAGVYSVTFRVSDGLLSDTETIQITVKDGVPPNNPPVLDPVGDKMVDEGQLLSFTISGSDPDSDPLTFSASGLPAGATFNPNTRTFSWTPDFTQAGSYFVTFRVSDGLLSDSETIEIVVKDATPANNPPVLAPIGNKVVTEGQTLSFAALATDADGDSLTFSAGPLPPGASFSGQTFTWNTDFDDAGVYTVTFTVSDGKDTDSETITITVIDKNHPPVITSTPVTTARENILYTYDVDAVDADGDTITYSLVTGPAGMTIDTVTGLVEWIPTTAQIGTHTVTVAASDGKVIVPQTYTVTVGEDGLSVKIKADKTKGNAPLKVNFEAVVSGGKDPKTIEWDFDNDGTFDATGRLTMAEFKKNGMYIVKVKVTDAMGRMAEDTIVIKVQDVTAVQKVVHIGQIAWESEIVQAGDQARMFVNFENQGTADLNDARLTAIIQELGIRSQTRKSEVDSGQDASNVLVLDIPAWTEPGRYWVQLVIDIDGDRRVKYRPIDVI